MSEHTPGPWFVGAQNDLLYVTAGRPPAPNNDHPWHDAPRVAVARIFHPSGDDCLPVDVDANARLIAAAPELLTEHDVRVSDLFMLRKAIEAGDPKRELLVRIDDMLRDTRAIIAKATQP